MNYTPAEWREKGEFFSHNEYNIFYVKEDSGHEETVLLLHGFPTSSWDWIKVWQKLAKSYNLIALDFLGFGFSDKPKDHTYRFSEQVNIVKSLCSEISTDSIHILSHDYGDTVLQELLSQDFENSLDMEINSAFMLNGGIFPEEIRFRFIQRLLMSPIGWIVSRFISKRRFDKSFSSIFAFDKTPTEKELEGFWSIVSHNDGHRIGHKLIRYIEERFENQERWVNAFIDTTVPLHFLVGTEDPVSGKAMGDFFEEFVGEEFVTFLPEIGHYPQWEDPSAVIRHYSNFIQSAT